MLFFTGLSAINLRKLEESNPRRVLTVSTDFKSVCRPFSGNFQRKLEESNPERLASPRYSTPFADHSAVTSKRIARDSNPYGPFGPHCLANKPGAPSPATIHIASGGFEPPLEDSKSSVLPVRRQGINSYTSISIPSVPLPVKC